MGNMHYFSHILSKLLDNYLKTDILVHECPLLLYFNNQLRRKYARLTAHRQPPLKGKGV